MDGKKLNLKNGGSAQVPSSDQQFFLGAEKCVGTRFSHKNPSTYTVSWVKNPVHILSNNEWLAHRSPSPTSLHPHNGFHLFFGEVFLTLFVDKHFGTMIISRHFSASNFMMDIVGLRVLIDPMAFHHPTPNCAETFAHCKIVVQFVHQLFLPFTANEVTFCNAKLFCIFEPTKKTKA